MGNLKITLEKNLREFAPNLTSDLAKISSLITNFNQRQFTYYDHQKLLDNQLFIDSFSLEKPREISNTEEVANIPLFSDQIEGYSLARIDEFVNSTSLNSPINGAGLAVVIIDSGIDLDHFMFGENRDGDGISDRIVYQYDFGDNDNIAQDVDGHGSHVSSIIANVAPGAKLIHLKVFKDGSQTADTADIEQALQWVTKNLTTYNIASVNLSIGAGNINTSFVSGVIGDELETLANHNVIISAAAGNNFFQYDSQPGVSWLAADPNVISVGAVYEKNEGNIEYESGAIDFTSDRDRIASFSQRDADLLDILAPGVLITGADTQGGTMLMSGTSQATSFISAIAILAQDLALEKLGRKLTVAEFRQLIQVTGIMINDGDDENDNIVNTHLSFPRVDAYRLGMGIAAAAITGLLSTAVDNFQTGTDDPNILLGSNKADYIFAAGGRDKIYGQAGDDTLIGGDGNDRIFGKEDNDWLIGGAGADILKGNLGKDTLEGNEGKDYLLGNGGDDLIEGGNGKDTLIGGYGNDRLFGEKWDDDLRGNNGKDLLVGGSGRDTLNGGNGRDTLVGGAGADYFWLDNLQGYDLITDFSQGDKIIIASAALSVLPASSFTYEQLSETLYYDQRKIAILANNQDFDQENDLIIW